MIVFIIVVIAALVIGLVYALFALNRIMEQVSNVSSRVGDCFYHVHDLEKQNTDLILKMQDVKEESERACKEEVSNARAAIFDAFDGLDMRVENLEEISGNLEEVHNVMDDVHAIASSYKEQRELLNRLEGQMDAVSASLNTADADARQ
jgi:uncharacterized protein YoxC